MQKLRMAVVLVLGYFLCVVPPLTSASLAANEPNSDSPEQALRAMVRANAEKDLPTLEQNLAQDPDMVGYTIGGRKYVGPAELIKALQEEFNAVDRLEITITDLQVWTNGDVAWFSMELNYTRHVKNDRGSTTMTLPLRDTGVLERRNGRWLLVSWHESFRAQRLDGHVARDLQK